MATITKLGQTFVAKTEATAASQNIQNAKIDELIDIFGKETTGDTKTIAIPFTKDSSPVKVTTLGTGLSVSSNTLSVDAFNYATATGAGIVKVGNGLEMVASTSENSTKDKLQVKAGNGIAVTNTGVAIKTDSTLTFDANGNLKVKNPSEGKTYTATAPIAISSADVISLSCAAPLTVPTSGDNANKLTVQNATTSAPGVVTIKNKGGISVSSGEISLSVDNSTIKLDSNGKLYVVNTGDVTSSDMYYAVNSTTIDPENYFNVSSGGNYYFNFGKTTTNTKVTFSSNQAQIVANAGKSLILYLPTDKKVFNVINSQSQSITNNFTYFGDVTISGKLYRFVYWNATGSVSGTYTITKSDTI